MRVGLFARALPALDFGGAATAAWWLLLLAEMRLVTGAPTTKDITALASIALGYSLAASAVVASVAVAERILGRWPRGLLITAILVAGAAAWPAVNQAAFLTAGDGISGSAWVDGVEAGLSLGLVLSTVGIWWWHRLGVRGLVWAAADARTRGWWVLMGGLIGLGLVYGTSSYLDAYAHFAMWCTAASWVVVATGTYRGIQSFCPGAGAFGLLLIPLAWLGADQTPWLDGTVAGYARLTLAAPADASKARFDISNPARFRCRAPGPATPPAWSINPDARRNVLIVSLDGLRDEIVDLHIEARPVMPALRRFASESVRFTDASTPYPATLYALGSALTGLSPSRIAHAPQLPPNLFAMVGDSVPRRFAVLPQSAWFEMPIVDALFVTPAQRSTGGAEAEAITDRIIEHLRAARASGERTLAWVHYMDTHMPYSSHRGRSYGADIRGRYLGAAAHLDQALGRLFDYLRTHQWLDDTLVLVFSDHGQALGERGYVGHHVFLNRWLISVPLVLHAPNTPPRTIAAPVGLIDVARTILDFLAIEPTANLEGRSLLAAVAAPDPERRLVAEAFPVRGHELFEQAGRPIESVAQLQTRIDQLQTPTDLNYTPKVSIIEATHRFILSRRTGALALYDRSADPAETRNLAASRRDVTQAALDALDAWHAAQSEAIYCAVAGR